MYCHVLYILEQLLTRPHPAPISIIGHQHSTLTLTHRYCPLYCDQSTCQHREKYGTAILRTAHDCRAQVPRYCRYELKISRYCVIATGLWGAWEVLGSTYLYPDAHPDSEADKYPVRVHCRRCSPSFQVSSTQQTAGTSLPRAPPRGTFSYFPGT